MDCKILKLNNDDQFISKIKNSDGTLQQFYQYDAMSEDSFKKKMDATSNGREKELANVIQSYMEDLSITEAQQTHLDALANGAKVVIGGQQAGLFGGPLYTIHKIFSIITLSQQLSNKYNQTVVPVFWIAGEDHDFDEVNHTFAYNQQDAHLHKIKYHTMTPPESNVSRFNPEQSQMIEVLNDYFKQLKETEHSKAIYQMCLDIIKSNDNWSNIFKALLHEIFKDYGVLFIDAQYTSLRKMEKPLLKEMILKHRAIDEAFRNNQKNTTQQGLSQMIQTDTNVHLFLHEEGMRQLLTYENDAFHLSKSTQNYNQQQLLDILDEEPDRFSNNVVTRPIMEEWLFNTVAFIGGPSEIKYWAELHDVFQLLNIDMPIVLPRLRITYLYNRTQKLLNQYQLQLEQVIENGIEEDKQKFIREQASETFLNEIDSMKQQQENLFHSLYKEVQGNNANENLVTKNNEIHLRQYDYLKKRYLLNIERENDISMRHFREINDHLHAMGGLQERIWNPLQILNDFGKDVFSPSTYPPLSYTFDHIIIKD
ncbi:bacillithiol biosynthesis cysteine-adding enzyme BshC [Staphylococcus pasteuri]|uniref:bacillithiol biosynthesis cysteine-adding enzyme BshC n=1 Tax=Staphylococcus pasteuri TaxID=45972 RepID=UPI002DBC5661|nr:bacillithiol biosynthesis cysteine-adding enzyme BshC [Staphylococcus pasteuri]MEB7433940.1 bacillithiol biosynthesis cysteine-adding enzyme BshC [Staphylococcus pasteuri]